ncbi:uncharacterized protein LY89DRAFT_649201 [Mollisia scopiformis]|uniref:SprT-like domain-containing protein n=1 Tax=Mollisia scopiformis TaxID=149040 RepID=A0A194X3F2_MOLSC|nr:uncharacterized protein LY89DRAFT_649201 [Mollisia scopiformis]KUJ14725.1 hypothetical protein LY89DRAFT_649201 [Mollisia scopiformis]
MARIVEDSDDELPELGDLVKSLKGGAREVLTKKDVVTGRDGDGERRISEEKEKKMEVIKKKRVLKKVADNPLLRPLDAQPKSKPKAKDVSGGAKSRLGSVADLDGPEICSGEGEKAVKAGLKGEGGKRTASGDAKGKSRSCTRLDELLPDEEKKSTRPKSKVQTSEGDVGKRTVSGSSGLGMKARNTAPVSSKAKTTKTTKVVEESDPEEHYDSEGLSDFVVDDSTFLEEEDSGIEMPPPPPRSTRKLVQGRRVKKDESFNDDDLDLELKKLTIKDDLLQEKELKVFVAEFSGEEDVPRKSVPRKLFEDVRIEPPRRLKDASPQKKYDPPSSDIEDPFTLRYSPSENKPKKISKETRFRTPPRSPEPKPRGLQSPKKTFQRIPSTPHRQSMDTFWQQDVINDWNDEYSPRKTPKPQPKPKSEDDTSSTILTSPKKSPTKQDRAAKEAKKAFSRSKHEIASSFLTELDSKITNNQISTLSTSTGGVKIIWSKKLNTTAGRANWKRETIKSLSSAPTYRHHASIELAEKVIDCEDRLLNVIAHEFCHLANFMVSGIKNNPHGKEFKEWAAKVSTQFGDRGIEVTTKHSYVIDYNYVWECESCGVEFKRHSKSVDPARHTCGSCKGRLRQTKPPPKKTGEGEKKVGEYQMFVKENMKRVREENPGSPQKEIMGLVGKRYQEYKASKLGGGTVSVDEVEVEVEEEVGDVVRKLDFLDLTSP